MARRLVCAVPDCAKEARCRCSVCKVLYCSPDCQAQHWPDHKIFCLPVPALQWPRLVSVSAGHDVSSEEVVPDIDDKDRSPDVTNLVEEYVMKHSSEEAHTIKEVPVIDIEDSSPDVSIINEEPIVKDSSKGNFTCREPLVIDIEDSSTDISSVKEVSTKDDRSKDQDVSVIKDSSENLSNMKEVSDITTPNPNSSMKMTEPSDTANERSEEEESSGAEQVTPLKSVEHDEAVSVLDIKPQLVDGVPTEVHCFESLKSPTNFCLTLSRESQESMRLLSRMNTAPPYYDADREVGFEGPLCVLSGGLWVRGMPLEKNGHELSVFLIDSGNFVTVTEEELRPLPEEFLEVPPFAYQVSLAGVGPKTGEKFSKEECVVFSLLLSNSRNDYSVKFLGQLEGGRWLVRLETEDQDLSQLLVEEELLSPALLPPITPLEVVGEDQTEDAWDQERTGPVLPVMTLRETDVVEGSVCHLETPDVFFLCPTDNMDLIEKIFLRSQSRAVMGRVAAVPGTCCLVTMEDNLFRAEIKTVSSDGLLAEVFLVDCGMTLETEVASLKCLPEELASVPGLVIRVHLRGVRPAAGQWTEQEVEAAKIILDVEGDTDFTLTDIKCVKGECWANVLDLQGRDVVDLLIKTKAAVLDSLKGHQLVPSPGLKEGRQSLVILSALSTEDLHLCTTDQFEDFTQITCSHFNQVAAEEADFIYKIMAGDYVFAFNKDNWLRAKIVREIPNYSVEVKLIDTLDIVHINKNLLRKLPPEILKIPILATKCQMDSVGREEVKVEELLKKYDQVSGEVLHIKDGITRVKISSF